jgi:ubiquinone/menaquinone biosynthesis C-methylase UbiE
MSGWQKNRRILISKFMRLFFHLLYHPLAWTYDFVASTVSVGSWKSWVLSSLSYLPGPRVLELGHGPGHLQVALAEKHLQAFGLDASPQMSRIASQRLKKNMVSFRLVRAQAQSAPFPSSWFDQVVATFPSEYIFNPETLQEVHRLLKPGGIAVILPQARITGHGVLHRCAAWLFRLTGQTQPVLDIWRDHVQKPFQHLGMETTLDEIQLPGSVIQVILAEKPKT